MTSLRDAWSPVAYESRRPRLIARSRIIATIRETFVSQGFVEVETPCLQVCPGMEPNLTAFLTQLQGSDEKKAARFLHTSPEFAMKKLLVAGEKQIFQLARVFRNGEAASIHHPEFTMLEWYRAKADYSAIMDDCVEIVRATARAADTPRLTWKGRESDPHARWQRMTVEEAFDKHAGISIFDTITTQRGPEARLLAAEAKKIGVRISDGDSWDDIFFKVFMERIEPQLGHPVPTIITEYPAHMAALARLKPTDPSVAERFEVYICGMEIANAFSELTDAEEQRRRFENEQEAKRAQGMKPYPIDEDFLDALTHGMPESAGIALGIDRLVMTATGARDIADVLWLPVAAP